MQIIADTAEKLNCSHFDVFRFWVAERGLPKDLAIIYYEIYCNEEEIPEDLEDLCLDLLTDKASVK